MQLAPSLHRIGNDIVAAYLVDTPEGITVIDAGLPGHWRELTPNWRRCTARWTTSGAWSSPTATVTTSDLPNGCAATMACRSSFTRQTLPVLGARRPANRLGGG